MSVLMCGLVLRLSLGWSYCEVAGKPLAQAVVCSVCPDEGRGRTEAYLATVLQQVETDAYYTIHQGFAHLANPLDFFMDASVSAMSLPAAYANASAIHADVDAIDHDSLNATEVRLHISWNSKELQVQVQVQVQVQIMSDK